MTIFWYRKPDSTDAVVPIGSFEDIDKLARCHRSKNRKKSEKSHIRNPFRCIGSPIDFSHLLIFLAVSSIKSIHAYCGSSPLPKIVP